MDNQTVADDVRRALGEDLGPGDVTADLLPADRRAGATVICREHAVICGRPWFDEVFRQIDSAVTVEWVVREGERVSPGQTLCRLFGPVRALVSGERTALNFLQFLSAAATAARACADAVSGTGTEILDTRKTIPGLRAAQKYATACGGARNHRMGLYDAILIKENHIMAAGSIAAAVESARRQHPALTVEVEVENLEELGQALDAGADIVLLDNFSVADMAEAVSRTAGTAKLEASGNVELDGLAAIAGTGVDYISTGAITKHVRAVDLSMRFG